MIKEVCETSTSSLAAETNQTDPHMLACRAFRTLKAWQVDQYHLAVDENKWYMSERLGRNVAWAEAEYDFVHNEYYGCALKWRKEYCADRCVHFTSCKLGQHFCLGT